MGALAIMTADADRIRSLEAIYERYRDQVYGLAWKLLGDRHTAEDLTHDVFLRIHDHLHTFEGRSELGTWIYRITTNLCLNHLRRARRGSFFADLERFFGLVDREEPQMLRLIEAETRDEVLEAVQALPANYRAAVVLRDLEGLAYKEIASILEIPEGTVMSRIARGREILRKSLSHALD